MNHFLASLVLALSINELVHNMFEIWGMRQKVSWLKARMDNLPHGKWPININTKIKTILVHGSLLLTVTGTVLIIIKAIDIAILNTLKLAVAVLLLNYILTTHKVDVFHTEIGKILGRFKRL